VNILGFKTVSYFLVLWDIFFFVSYHIPGMELR